MDQLLRVAFVGLGRMGSAMASRLASAGFELRVHDIDAAAANRFVAVHGGVACANAAEAALDRDVVITMLPSDKAVEAAMLGDDGRSGAAAAAARAGVLVDMGTSSPLTTRAIAGNVSSRGLAYVDAPVMGGVPFARDGTLEVMAGGDSAAIDRLSPIFATLAHKVHRCGGVGTGHAFKAIANFVNAATLATLSEGLALGRLQGLDTAFMVEALGTLCTGRQHPLAKKVVPHIVTRRFASGMSLGLTAKDLGIAADLGGDENSVGSIARHMYELWLSAAIKYGDSADQTEIVRLWEDDAGVRI
jgi:3-hydroxyisobutyrate dehydrogenase